MNMGGANRSARKVSVVHISFNLIGTAVNMLEHVHAPKLMVYLEISVDEAMRRIAKRGRDYELVVEREYCCIGFKVIGPSGK